MTGDRHTAIGHNSIGALLHQAPWVIALLGAASAAALAFAFFSQYVLNLQPCVLCIYQRWPYGGVIAVALVFWLLLRYRPRSQRWGLLTLLLMGLLLLADAGIAGHHVGVEQQWWAGSDACTGPSTEATSVDALRAQIMATPIIRCDDIAWSLFGLSMASLNFLLALGLSVVAFASAYVSCHNTPSEAVKI